MPSSRKEKFCEGADGDASGGFASGGALENVAGFREVVLQRAGKVGMAGARRGDALVFCRIAIADRKRFLPIFPIAVRNLQRNRGSNGDAMANAGYDMGGIALDLHASAAAVALLAAPKLAIEEGLIDL